MQNSFVLVWHIRILFLYCSSQFQNGIEVLRAVVGAHCGIFFQPDSNWKNEVGDLADIGGEATLFTWYKATVQVTS